jgi:hypothetical protein
VIPRHAAWPCGTPVARLPGPGKEEADSFGAERTRASETAIATTAMAVAAGTSHSRQACPAGPDSRAGRAGRGDRAWRGDGAGLGSWDGSAAAARAGRRSGGAPVTVSADRAHRGDGALLSPGVCLPATPREGLVTGWSWPNSFGINGLGL